MGIEISDLWRWKGTIGRRSYFVLGAGLFLLKSQLDSLVASQVFHQPWSPYSYLNPGRSGTIASIAHVDQPFYATMVAIALPFIWCGVALTLRRLRDAKLPIRLAILFFVPVANLFVFAILCIVPSPNTDPLPSPALNTLPPEAPRSAHQLKHWVPEGELGSALLAMVATAILTVVGTVLSTQIFGDYGWGLFVGLPFCLGLTSSLIYGYHQERTWLSCVGVTLLALMLSATALLLIRIEGVICLLMAAPLAIPIAIMGATVGHSLHLSHHQPFKERVLFSVVLLLPSIMGSEYAAAPQAPLLTVVSVVEVDAPPEQVWQNVIAFSPLPEPQEWLFKLGVAYPKRAQISGRGPGAVRRCEFSTGAFVEPIETWDEPRLLKFSVTENPEPMQELSFYPSIHPPHLHGFLVASAGQFKLEALPSGRTRLEGTTWYKHSMWPVEYWQLWSDYIIEHIHLRVLNHIKRLCEVRP